MSSWRDSPDCHVEPDAEISDHAVISPSVRGSQFIVGSRSRIADFAVIRFVGGSGDIVIGADCEINEFCVFYSGNGIQLQDKVIMGPGCRFMPMNHELTSTELPIRDQGFAPSRGGIDVDEDVWLGANVVLLDGVKIGRGAVIAAGAVVRGVVPPLEVWGGIPARFIRRRES
jgi:virginiamycin A acetyltransferase